MNKRILMAVGATFAIVASQSAMAACSDIAASFTALQSSVNTVGASGGYGLPMWVTAVDETGKVCYVVTSKSEDVLAATGVNGAAPWGVSSSTTGAATSNKQWLGSRVISAQKANTANAFSVDGYSIATGNLYTAVNPGGSLYGLQHSNPVDASRAYVGNPASYGKANDALVGKRIGGVNVFGGGLALYKTVGSTKVKVGAIGVSGDTSCRDHAFAWDVRAALSLNNVPTGITAYNADSAGGGTPAIVTAANVAPIGDELIIDTKGTPGTIGATHVNNLTGVSAAAYNYWKGWSQPACPLVDGAHPSYILIE